MDVIERGFGWTANLIAIPPRPSRGAAFHARACRPFSWQGNRFSCLGNSLSRQEVSDFFPRKFFFQARREQLLARENLFPGKK